MNRSIMLRTPDLIQTKAKGAVLLALPPTDFGLQHYQRRHPQVGALGVVRRTQGITKKDHRVSRPPSRQIHYPTSRTIHRTKDNNKPLALTTPT